MIKNRIKEFMKTNPAFMDLTSNIYNLIHYNNSWKYLRKNNFHWKGAFLKSTSFHINGSNNKVQLGSKTHLKNCRFTFIGNNCKVIIGGGIR